MSLLKKTLVLGLVLMGGIAFAEEQAKDPTVIAWKELMGKNGAAAKVLGDMAGGKAPFDAAAAEAAKAMLIADAAAIPAAFQTQASDPASEAKPEIWAKWDDFVAKAKGLEEAANLLDVSSPETLAAGMGAVGGACAACHKPYRM